MGLESVLQKIKKSYTPRKKVDFDDIGLHFELEPLTTLDEVKVMESIKGIDESIYVEALKRHSVACSIRKIVMEEDGNTTTFDLSGEFIDFLDENNQPKTKSRFLYMLDFLGQWPNAVIDILFEAFTNMHQEIDAKVRKQGKFEVFRISEKPAEDKERKNSFKVIEEDSSEGLSEAEALERRVKKEIDEEDMKIARNG